MGLFKKKKRIFDGEDHGNQRCNKCNRPLFIEIVGEDKGRCAFCKTKYNRIWKDAI